MNRFENCISAIDSEISIQREDRQIYTEDFNRIRNYLLQKMQQENDVFKKIYGGPSLFGSFYHNDRIGIPDEFDVHFLLNLPFYKHIKVKRDNQRPGFVKLCLSKVLSLMLDDPNLHYVYDVLIDFVDEREYLCRSLIQNWLEEIIIDVLYEYGNRVRSCTGEVYELIYLKRGTAHTIKAISDSRKISIDFVPAFKFDARNYWFADIDFPENVREPLWFAVPKPTVGPKHGRRLTFSICVPQMENDLLINKYNLKVSLRLFKSLRDKMHVFKLKTYFIRSLYFHECDAQTLKFWMQPAGAILMHMIAKLLDYLDDECLPFYWCPDMNLFDNLSDDQISDLSEKFEEIHSKLSSYYHQPQINYTTVRSLFISDEYTFNKPLKKEYA